MSLGGYHPVVVRQVVIQVFSSSELDEEALIDSVLDAAGILEDARRANGAVEASEKGCLCRYSVEKIGRFLVLTSNISALERRHLPIDAGHRVMAFDVSESFSALTGSDLLTTFTVCIHPTERNEDEEVIVNRFIERTQTTWNGVGKIGHCYITFSHPNTREDLKFDRVVLIQPVGDIQDVEKGMANTLENVKQIAASISELYRVYSKHVGIFSVLESGEAEISTKIEDFLWRLLKPEPVDYTQLESWLSYVMERDSTTSAILSSLMTSHVEAREAFSELEIVLSTLNEDRMGSHPTVMEWEVLHSERVVWAFKRAIARAEGLKGRLEAVMEEIRTYLSLQQQKLSLEEQKASRDQLTRLVRLQETLHKLEIIIVAVYILEMGRIVFETVAHEHIGVLSVAFIPVALLLSVVINRELSKGH